jgi:hypothetical protein
MSDKTTTIKAWGGTRKAYYSGKQAWVWDPCAGHYTSCHSLSVGQVRRVKARANRDNNTRTR